MANTWATDAEITAAKLNQQTLLQLTGPEATALTPMYPGQLIYVTSADGAFLADNYYRRNAANNAWARMVVSGGTIDTSIGLLAQGEIRLYETDNTNYLGWKAPTAVTANKIWTLPDGDGSNGQVMKTNGAGTLAWGSAGIERLTRRSMYPGSAADSHTTFTAGTGSVVNMSGTIDLLTGATTGGDAGIYVEYDDISTANVGGFRRDRAFELYIAVRDNNTANEVEIGLTDQLGSQFSGNNDDFAVFYKDYSVDANWRVRTNDNGASAPAAVDTGITNSGAIYQFAIINDETDIKFYINGVLEHTATSDLPTATTLLNVKVWNQTEACSNATVTVFPWAGYMDVA